MLGKQLLESTSGSVLVKINVDPRFLICFYFASLRAVYKSKLELKQNWSKILPVNCKFICNSTPTQT